MWLARKLRKVIPPHITEEIQAWMVLAGLVGMVIAPLLPLGIAVKVINMVSMLTLTVAGIAGVDSARPSENDSR